MCSGEDFWVDSQDIDYELFGKPVVTWTVGKDKRDVDWRRDRSGLLVPKRRDLSDPQNTRLSPVVFCKRDWAAPPEGSGRLQYIMEVYHNPWAACPLDQGVFPKLAQFVPVRDDRGIRMEWNKREEGRVIVFG